MRVLTSGSSACCRRSAERLCAKTSRGRRRPGSGSWCSSSRRHMSSRDLSELSVATRPNGRDSACPPHVFSCERRVQSSPVCCTHPLLRQRLRLVALTDPGAAEASFPRARMGATVDVLTGVIREGAARRRVMISRVKYVTDPGQLGSLRASVERFRAACSGVFPRPFPSGRRARLTHRPKWLS
jgi:hypothetical protein